jgi:hypothetical protein
MAGGWKEKLTPDQRLRSTWKKRLTAFAIRLKADAALLIKGVNRWRTD